MSQSLSNSTSLRSMCGIFGQFQLVSTTRGVVVDVLARNYDTDGRLHQHHALANLPLPDARRLHELLGAAIAAAECAEPRQPGLWSDETVRQAARRVGRGFVWPAKDYGPKSGGGRKP